MYSVQYEYKGNGSDDKSKKKKKKDKDSDAEDEPEDKKKNEEGKPEVAASSAAEQNIQNLASEDERLVYIFAFKLFS